MLNDTPASSAKDAVIRSAIDRSLRNPVMFFMTSGAAWLSVSIILGLISSIKMFSPGFLADISWLSYGRVYAAHLNLMVYGWGFQAAFGVIIWLMSRLNRQECKAAGIILVAGHLWNLAVTMGTLGILAGAGTGMPWLEFPSFTWPVLLLSYFAIITWSLVQFKFRPAGQVYISQWYLLAAVIWFPWVFLTTNLLVHVFPGHPVMANAIVAWYKSSLIFLFFTPVAMAAAFYLVPKVTGKGIQSYALSKLGFWSLAVIMPWAGMQKLAGAPVPFFLPYIGALATVLFFIPAVFVAVNLLTTAFADMQVVANSPTLRFTITGIICMLVMAGSGVLINLPGATLPLSQFSLSGYGFEILAIYAFFSFVMFGAIYFIVPRITMREWLSRRLITFHYYISIYGIALVGLVAIFGGLMQGYGQEKFLDDTKNLQDYAIPYIVAFVVAWIFILVSNTFFVLHLLVMWLRLGRRSNHPTLLTSSHGSSPHGDEGDREELGHGSAPVH